MRLASFGLGDLVDVDRDQAAPFVAQLGLLPAEPLVDHLSGAALTEPRLARRDPAAQLRMHPQQDRQERLGRRAPSLAAERHDGRVHAAVELPKREGVEREARLGHHATNDGGLGVDADLGGPACQRGREVTRLERPGQPARVLGFGHPTPFDVVPAP